MIKTLQGLLDTFAGNSKPAVIIPQKTPLHVSYNDLYNQVQYLQDEFASLGINSCSRLLIVLPNSFQFVALFLAISCMRATSVPLNPALRQNEYTLRLDDLRPSAIIVPQGAFCERHAAVLAALVKGVTVIECHLSEGQIVVSCEYRGSSRLKITTMPERPAEQDVALISQTSGTTGRPKAVSATSLILFWG